MHQASSDGVKVSSKQTLHAFGVDSCSLTAPLHGCGAQQVGGRFVWLDYETRAPRRSFKTAQGQSWHKVNAKQRQGR